MSDKKNFILTNDYDDDNTDFSENNITEDSIDYSKEIPPTPTPEDTNN